VSPFAIPNPRAKQNTQFAIPNPRAKQNKPTNSAELLQRELAWMRAQPGMKGVEAAGTKVDYWAV
jgi:hypothetical protein